MLKKYEKDYLERLSYEDNNKHWEYIIYMIDNGVKTTL